MVVELARLGFDMTPAPPALIGDIPAEPAAAQHD
jgi:hypothetical protein